MKIIYQPNGMRYRRVGGTRSHYFAGTNSKPRKLLENAATPTRRVHAVLGGIIVVSISYKQELPERNSEARSIFHKVM